MPRYIEITDFHDAALDAYVRLTGAQQRRRLEPERGIFIAESPTVIEVAVNAGCYPLSILTERRLLNESAARAIDLAARANPDLVVYTAEHALLEEMTGFPLTRGVLAEMRRPAPRDAASLCRDATRIAVLEGIVDSTNIGAIFRSAAGLGIDAVLLTPTCCDPLCRRAVRVSMGTVFQVPFAYLAQSAEEWERCGVERLHALGFTTAAMALSDDSVSLDDPALNAERRLAVLLGTEGDGLARTTIAKCDYTVRIPMQHGVDSLNVAAASAVAFWQLRKRQLQNKYLHFASFFGRKRQKGDEMKILVVDDEKDIRTVVRLLLENKGYEVLEAPDGAAAVETVRADRGIDLVIMDIMMPRMSGLRAVEEIRKFSTLPVLFLTAKSLERDKENAYTKGGDDYLVKPFSSAELLRKAEALIRRYNSYGTKSDNANPDLLHLAGGVELDPVKREVMRRGESVDIRDKEMDVLIYLAKNRGRAVDAAEMYEAVWEAMPLPSSNNTVTVHILNLRQKLEENPSSPKLIRTVWGKGYQID